MNEPTTGDQLRAIAAQLAHPDGEAGIAMGHTRDASNTGMGLPTIAALGVQDGDRVLELGHGHCMHLEDLMAGRSNVRYHGLEISETMHRSSVEANKHFIAGGQACFSMYDGATLPFTDALFTKVFTVNTLYFWTDPAALLNELHRVLTPGGRLCVAFADHALRERLPFTSCGFTLYDQAAFAALTGTSPFGPAIFGSHWEQVTSKDGREVERTYHVATLTRSRA